jgi:hypothetical protein
MGMTEIFLLRGASGSSTAGLLLAGTALVLVGLTEGQKLYAMQEA